MIGPRSEELIGNNDTTRLGPIKRLGRVRLSARRPVTAPSAPVPQLAGLGVLDLLGCLGGIPVAAVSSPSGSYELPLPGCRGTAPTRSVVADPVPDTDVPAGLPHHNPARREVASTLAGGVCLSRVVGVRPCGQPLPVDADELVDPVGVDPGLDDLGLVCLLNFGWRLGLGVDCSHFSPRSLAGSQYDEGRYCDCVGSTHRTIL